MDSKLISDSDWVNLPQPIGLLGGSFDPVQNAHIEMARTSISSNIVKSVVFIPAQQNPHKSLTPTAPVDDRIQMLRLGLSNLTNCYVSDIENSLPVPSYTIDTIEQVQKFLGDKAKIFFLGGSDLLPDFHRWNRAHDIVSKLEGFVVFSRITSAKSEIAKLACNFSEEELSVFIPFEIDEKYKEISASAFRNLQKQGVDIKDLVPEQVLEYIKSKNLYFNVK